MHRGLLSLGLNPFHSFAEGLFQLRYLNGWPSVSVDGVNDLGVGQDAAFENPSLDHLAVCIGQLFALRAQDPIHCSP